MITTFKTKRFHDLKNELTKMLKKLITIGLVSAENKGYIYFISEWVCKGILNYQSYSKLQWKHSNDKQNILGVTLLSFTTCNLMLINFYFCLKFLWNNFVNYIWKEYSK